MAPILTESAETDNTPRQVTVTGDLDAKAVYEFGRFDYRYWLGVAAAEFEADQDFDEINYVFKPFARAEVPFTKDFSHVIQSAFGKPDAPNKADWGSTPIRVRGSSIVAHGFAAACPRRLLHKSTVHDAAKGCSYWD